MNKYGRNAVLRSANDLRSTCDDAAPCNCAESQPSDMTSQMQAAQPSRYAIYARVARDEAGRDRITEQVHACQNAAAKFDPQLSLAENGIFTDVGTSGNNLERSGLKALIDFAQQQPSPFKHVFMTDPDRLARNLAQVLPIIDIFTYRGITLHFAHQRMSTADPNFHLLLRLYRVLDEQYLEAHRLNVRRGMTGRLKQGFFTGGRFYGYEQKSAGNGTRLSINTSEAATVRRIYSDFASGLAVTRIASALNAEQVPGPAAAKWTARNVYAVLRRSIYRGKLLWGTTRKVRNLLTGELERRRVPDSEVLATAVPNLAIVNRDLASAVDERLALFDHEHLSEAGL